MRLGVGLGLGLASDSYHRFGVRLGFKLSFAHRLISGSYQAHIRLRVKVR